MTDTSEHMNKAIAAANGLRVQLERVLDGPLTVAPHATLLGGVVAIYVGEKQAGQLEELIRLGENVQRRKRELDESQG